MTRSVFEPTVPSALEVDDLRRICEALRRRGWNSRLVCWPVCGELDVRVEVRGPGRRTVELLGPFGDRPCPDGWRAVRVQPGSRTTWCGPAGDGADGNAGIGVVGFVEDLLRRGVRDLGGRYVRIG